MKVLYLVLIICTLTILKTNAALVPGVCSNVPVMNNFDATKYSGRWYAIETVPASAEKGLRCVTADYAVLNATTVSVLNKGLKADNSVDTANGLAVIENSAEPNKLTVYFNFNINGVSFSRGSPYNVWQTDYSSFSLVYSCSQALGNINKNEFTWILSRTRTLSQTKVNELKAFLKSNNIDTNLLSVTGQTNCE